MSKDNDGKTSAGVSKTIHVPVPDQPKQVETGTVSKPMGGLYAGPASGTTAPEGTGPQITSTSSMAGHPPGSVTQRQRPPEQTEAMKREIDARKKGAEVQAEHDKALDKAKEQVASRTPEGKTGHSISPTVRQDEHMAAAKALGAPHVDIATGEKDRPMRYDPEAPISHSITPTIREDEELGIIPKDRAITKEEAEKKTDYDNWVISNERQQSPNQPVLHKGEYDGRVTISFHAGKAYKHDFEFALPNVLGTLGVAGLNDEAITMMIEKALIEKLGSGGVVRVTKA